MNLLHAIMSWARHPAQSYLAHDPLIGQKRLKRDRTERDFLEPRETQALLQAAGSIQNNAILHVLLYAGLRRGEAFALQWGDIDRGDGKHGGRLMIRRSIYQGDITRPKTTNAERAVDVPQRVLDVLARHREAHRPDEGDFIFRTGAGTPIDPDNWYKRVFRTIQTRAGLRTFGIPVLRCVTAQACKMAAPLASPSAYSGCRAETRPKKEAPS